MGNKKGFTLIEILIVLALASILIGMTISVGFRAVKDAGYRGAVNKLLAEISYVKQLAARENRYILFEFNTDGKSYSIKKQQTLGTPVTFNITIKTGTFFDEVSLNKGEFFDGSKTANYDFVSNSMGMIFKKTDILSVTNPIPSKITVPVFFKNEAGTVESSDSVIINPSGGIHVQKN